MYRFSLLGVCGLHCGACYHYCAALPESNHLLDEAGRQEVSGEGFTCKGCRSDSLSIHRGCAECAFRACAEKREILHCGLCADFPCQRLKAFQNDGRPHHRDVFDNIEALKAHGPEEWLLRQTHRWTCGCGARFSWYEVKCHACGTELNSYGPAPR